MSRMDRARRRGGLLWIGAGVVFELGWAAFAGLRPGPITLVIAGVMVLLAALVATRVSDPRLRVAGTVTAVVLALDLAGAVADRFGAWGPPGASGVSWGSWSAFVDYTSLLLGGVPRPWASVAAVFATAVEVVLALLLVSGAQRRWVGKATAGLFVVYLVSMTLTVGPGAVAAYALPILVGGALLVSAIPAREPLAGRDRGAVASWDSQ